ncbi:hypothetical protein ACFLQ6_01765 [Thermoproteota archaeon]
MLSQNEKGNVILFASNQSLEINVVDIEILIDGKIAVKSEFAVAGNQLPQHNWRQFRFQLERGIHSIVISSKKGNARLEREFRVSGSHTAYIAYWYDMNNQKMSSKKYFTFTISDKSPAYM